MLAVELNRLGANLGLDDIKTARLQEVLTHHAAGEGRVVYDQYFVHRIFRWILRAFRCMYKNNAVDREKSRI